MPDLFVFVWRMPGHQGKTGAAAPRCRIIRAISTMTTDISRRMFFAILGGGLLTSARTTRAQSGRRLFAYVGSWTTGPFGVGGGGGLHVFTVDTSNGALTPVMRTTGPA